MDLRKDMILIMLWFGLYTYLAHNLLFKFLNVITKQLLNPQSIVVVGASNDTSKPGGKVLQNILQHQFNGAVYGVNPKETTVQGKPCFASIQELPNVDLAIVAIAANYVEQTMIELTTLKNCKAIILFSAGFSEIGEEGRLLEERCAAIANKAGASFIGPNCIGVITGNYKGVFAGPIPAYDPMGCDCVSASGATMVYILEAAIPRGLKFRDIFSVGNSAQIGVEDVLEYWDNTFDPKTSSRIKLLYMEQISDSQRFLKHARSLTEKGCRIAAIKAGSTEAGSRAVSSHTGALAGSNSAVNALFRKAGIIRCYSRVELVYVAGVFTIPELAGNRLAIITHAGGPGVLLTDVLTKNGMVVPPISGPKADELLGKLFKGSSVANPIDFLATGTAEQLGIILDYVENELDDIDGSVVVFGTTGMWKVDDVYGVLHEKIKTCKKPIYPILPSVVQAAEEVSHFHSKGHVNFLDEVSFGYVLSRVNKTHKPYPNTELPNVDKLKIRTIIDEATAGYLPADKVFELFDAAGIKRVQQATLTNLQDTLAFVDKIGFPVVMKVSGPVHKSDIGGVVVGVKTEEEVKLQYERLMHLPESDGVIIQQMLSGIEIYIGAKAEDDFGHQVLVGLGGVFVEVFKDVSSGLAPISEEEAIVMIKRLKSYPIIQGARGKEGVDEKLIIDTLTRVSALVAVAPEISEMDINPLLGNSTQLVAVDARVCLEK